MNNYLIKEYRKQLEKELDDFSEEEIEIRIQQYIDHDEEELWGEISEEYNYGDYIESLYDEY